MMRAVSVFFALTISSCAKPAVPLTYPAGWPVAQLTVPSNASPAKLPSPMQYFGDEYTMSGRTYNVGSPGELKKWCVGFNTDQSWEQVYTHCDKCLKPLGYSLARRKDEEEPMGNGKVFVSKESAYISSDRTVSVRLLFMNNAYSLSIDVYNQPLDPRIFKNLKPIP